ncbi:MAG TPA: hypothetical protein DCX17_01355 [Firmicutes bacterium]|jgi:hypothetical protein|nr:hypothetical protein [Bacillota bacterium]
MFELMIGVSVISFIIALFGTPIILLLLRIFEVITRKTNIKDALFIILTPFSLGYFYLIPSNGAIKKIYRGASIFFFVMLLLGSIFIFYMTK